MGPSADLDILKEIKSLAPPGIELRSLGFSVRSLVNISTEESGLPVMKYNPT